jgi:MFS family permease
MIESLHVPQSEVGKWVGICAAVFSLTQAIMGIPWGRFSDRYGRKPAILLGLTGTMTTNLLWGFSTNLPLAIIARALAGASNGNLGIIRTTVAEMVPCKALQPRAFSLMPLVWSIGSIFGPIIGGALANPLNVKPGEEKQHSSLFGRFPYALPNIVCACFFFVSIAVGILYLDETLETLRDHRDHGRILGRKVTNLIKTRIVKIRHVLHIRSQQSGDGGEGVTDPLLQDQRAGPDEEDGTQYDVRPRLPPTWREVVTKQAFINLVVYTLLAMHSMAFDQIIAVYMQLAPIGQEGSTPYEAPLKFAGGFGLNHLSIGLMSTGYGIVGMALQFLIFPPLARCYGVLSLLKVVACAFPVIYFMTPFAVLLPTARSQIGCLFTVMTLKCFCGVFAFPCSAILITNSASSMRTLGTLNGIAIAVSAVGRAAGPAILGALTTIGVKSGYIVIPWWFMTAIAVIAAIPVFWLMEGEGFGRDDDGDDTVLVTGEEEEDNKNPGGLAITVVEIPAEALVSKPGASAIPEQDKDRDH